MEELSDLYEAAANTKACADVALAAGANPADVIDTILRALGMSLDTLPAPFRMMIASQAAKAIQP